MRVLVVGSGAREHALCLALAADPKVTALACAPGNAGTAAVAEQPGVDPMSGAAVADLAARLRSDLVVIGPEGPLVAGVADAVRAAGSSCFGPSAAAARLEGSKAFAKEVMASAGVPTARALVASTADEVAAALDEFGPPYVVKNDGLAAGKGVVVTADRGAAAAHAAACGRVVIEEYLDGPEVSLFCVTDGTTVVPLIPAQDFKRIGDGDTGPNTGGMGAYAPLPWLPVGTVDEVVRSASGARHSLDCSTSGWRSRRAGPASSSSTPGSEIPRPRSSWPCSTAPSVACSPLQRPANCIATLRWPGAAARRSLSLWPRPDTRPPRRPET